ncbi:MAG: Cupredoxin-like protein [Bacteroidota bacterium]|nr:Cupredoxin-like protein [Bacteroidota bacterium]
MKTKLFSLKELGVVTLIFVFAFAVHGCKKDSPGANQVFMQNTAFNPSTITVSKNATVTWSNKDGMAHTVTSDAGAFSSGNIAAGGSFSFQFTTTGTYQYHCTIHSGMTGTVIVQ